METINNNKVAQFLATVEKMAKTYEAKNHDYGDSFGRSFHKYGLIAALTRLSDKFNRAEKLILTGENKVDESLKDTLLDMASCCVMTVMELENQDDDDNPAARMA